jgi:hypothetical protein
MIDRSLRTIAHALLLVAAMLALIAAGLWFHDTALEPRAVARPKTISPEATGVPDSGRQRQMIVEELKKLNTRVQGIESALKGGDYVIQTKPVAGEAGAAGGGP